MNTEKLQNYLSMQHSMYSELEATYKDQRTAYISFRAKKKMIEDVMQFVDDLEKESE